jgi:DNA polymerase-3 subunit delta
VSAEPLHPVYLVTGTDRPKIRRALERLRGRFDESSIDVLSAEKSAEKEASTGADAVAACNALGLFGDDGSRLVVVERVERWNATDVDAIAGYVRDPAPATVLALVADEQVKGKLPEVCAKAGTVLVFDTPKPRDLPAWVREHFERRGARVVGDAPRALVEIVGDNPATLESEVDKIATWAGGEEIDREQVEALAVPVAEESAWAVTDTWGARNLPALLDASERALEHEKPFVVALRLANYVGRVRAVQGLADQGENATAIAKRLRIHEFPARKAAGHAQNYSREELDAAVVRLAELDARLKGASRLAPELELELALVDVTRTSERRQPATGPAS